MKVEAHFIALFDDDQRKTLGRMLDIELGEDLLEAEAFLSGVVQREQDLRAAHARAPEPQESQDAAERMGRHARALVTLLRDDTPLSDYVGFRLALAHRGMLSPDEAGPFIEAGISQLVDQLELIVSVMPIFTGEWDSRVRQQSDLGLSPTRWFWPQLFSCWEKHGRVVAFSEGGPLHRFVDLIHAAGRFEAANPSTLKNAARSWRHQRGSNLPVDSAFE